MEDGTRFAQLWANKTKGNTYALKNARSNYIFINCTMDEIERAYDLPGSKIDFAISDVINGVREKGNEVIATITIEILVKILGEEVRKAVETEARSMILFSVSEEWKR